MSDLSAPSELWVLSVLSATRCVLTFIKVPSKAGISPYISTTATLAKRPSARLADSVTRYDCNK